jgi:hypothetical protein
VRELRLAFVEGPSEECDPERETVSLVRRVPAELAWELEATLVGRKPILVVRGREKELV